MLERLERAFVSYNIDGKTQLCKSNIPDYTVDWGFCDTVIKSGYLLFPSLLRYRAALRLKEMFCLMGDTVKAHMYNETLGILKENIVKTFYDTSGWFLSATNIVDRKMCGVRHLLYG